ncbi:hypothetical protein GCM10010840_25380 [Deinococcus aerolatus]|uniref:Uncharacterized protein n=1 Tax=Deinococcus aerolatus TaxID=522487 RepID=A0ABQ2GCX0_9DEIO|nr:hypothetical protein GCM10010840_25380 [Deinococcus aerolatus]
MLDAVESREGSQGCTGAPEPIGMDNHRHVIFAQQSPEEQSDDLSLPVLLRKDVQHGSVIVDCSP